MTKETITKRAGREGVRGEVERRGETKRRGDRKKTRNGRKKREKSERSVSRRRKRGEDVRMIENVAATVIGTGCTRAIAIRMNVGVITTAIMIETMIGTIMKGTEIIATVITRNIRTVSMRTGEAIGLNANFLFLTLLTQNAT